MECLYRSRELPLRMAQRVLSIDVLRFAACALVLGCHADWPELTGPLAPLWQAWRTGGWVGVDLFFVLSGYLIGGLLLSELRRTGTLRVGRFLLRRGWKIYPAFYALIGFVLLFKAVHEIGPFSWRDTLSELFFLQNYGGHLLLHTWSLAVEEHFYLLLPLLLLALRGRVAWLPYIVAATVMACLAVRVAIGLPGAHMFTHARIDSLLCGVLLAYGHKYHAEAFERFCRKWKAPLAAGGTALLLPAFFFDHLTTAWIHTIGFTLFYVGSGMLLAAALAASWKATWPVKFLAGLGAHSYSIYLWHVPMLMWGVPLLERAAGIEFNPWMRVAVYMAGSLGLGVLLGRMIEQPCLALRDRLTNRGAAAAGQLPLAGERGLA